MLWPAMVRVVDTVRAVDTARVDTMDLQVDLRAAMSDRCVACTIAFIRILRPSMDPPDRTVSAAMDPLAEDLQGAATTEAVRPAVVPLVAATTAVAIPVIMAAVPQAVVRPVAATAARATTFRPMNTGQPKVATPFR